MTRALLIDVDGMKATFQALLIMAAVFSSRAADSPTKDGWSETVNGLRARLAFEEGHIFNGTHVPEVYLELHNASDVGNPMEFDFDAGKFLHLDLRSSNDKPGPKPDRDIIDGFVFGSFHVTLPRDGTLKFPIIWNGHAIPRNAGTALPFENAFWIIPANDPNEYSLSAALEVPETPRKPTGLQSWHGIIKIPAVKVPVKK
jgi:hypothetical protein